MTRSVVIIANGRFRQGRSARRISSVAKHLSDSGADVTVLFTESSQDGSHAAFSHARTADLIVAVGGDGTVNSVVTGMTGGTAALAIAAAGTGNDAARFLGHPHLRDDSISTWLADITNHECPAIDVGRAEFGDGSTGHFLTVLSTGFDTLVNERAHQLRRLPGAIRYVISTLIELPHLTAHPYVMETHENRAHADALLVAVGNSAMYGRGMRICPEASVQDGQVDLTIIGSVTRRTLVKLFPSVFTGAHMKDSRVSGMRSSSVVISGPSLVCYADGERMGPLPVRISVVPGSLRVAPAFTA
jgi:diacylglycerol kinase (ATP)